MDEDKKISPYKECPKKNDLILDLLEIFKTNINKINDLVT